MAEHTPTPYTHAGDIGTIIANIDGNRISIAVVASTGHDIDTSDSCTILPMGENRDFLIHAANSHDDLLQACKEYGEIFDDQMLKTLDGIFGDKYMVWLTGILDNAQNVIAEAKGAE